jgi:hypothetical protein
MKIDFSALRRVAVASCDGREGGCPTSSVNVPADKDAKQPHVSTRRAPSHPICLHSNTSPINTTSTASSPFSQRDTTHMLNSTTRLQPPSEAARLPAPLAGLGLAILVNSHGLWRVRTRPLRLTCKVQAKCRRRSVNVGGAVSGLRRSDGR